jgi:hypothetical protein
MITLKELNPRGVPLTPEMSANLLRLHVAMNLIRTAYGKPMLITSGVRSIEDHKRIYLELARKQGITNPRIPMGSKHLQAAACDVLDKDGALYRWCKENPEIMDAADVYLEEDQSQPRVHFQIIPFASYKPGGTRWFKP